MSACKEAIQKLRKAACLPAALEAMLEEALRKDEQHQGEPVEYYTATRLKRPGVDAISSVSSPWTVVIASQYDDHVGRLRAQLAELRRWEATVRENSPLLAEVERLRAELENSYTVTEHERLVAKGQEINISCINSLRAQLAERDSFIHDLEANCDPSGNVRENTLLRDQTKQLNAMIGRLKIELAEAHALLREADEFMYAMTGNDTQRDLDARYGVLQWEDAICALRGRIASSLSAGAEPSAPHEETRWQPLTAPGQIQEGDRLSFRVGSSFICARARQIIAPGTDKEEVVYNRKKNHYFLTSMAVDGTSSHKNVMVARVTA